MIDKAISTEMDAKIEQSSTPQRMALLIADCFSLEMIFAKITFAKLISDSMG